MANKDITETGVRSVLETMGIPSSFQGFKDNAIGRVEAAATVGSSIAGTVAGMGGNIFELMRSGDPQAALDQYRQIQEAMTYAPRTQGGLEDVQQIGEFFEPVGQLYEQYGESVGEAAGSTLAGEYAEEFLDPLFFLGGIGAIPKRASRIADAAEGATKVARQADPTIQVDLGVPEARLDEIAEQSIRAYHGSPYDFERFDLERIGSGEGAQMYGYGLYFAEETDVARGYRKELSDLRLANDIQPVDADAKAELDQVLNFADMAFNNVVDEVAFEYPNPTNKNIKDLAKAKKERATNEDYQKAYETIERLADEGKFQFPQKGTDLNKIYNELTGPKATDLDYQKAEIIEQIMIDGDVLGVSNRQKEFNQYTPEAYAWFEKEIASTFDAPGTLFEVNIKANPDDLLDWEIPVIEQPKIMEKVSDTLMSDSAWKSYVAQLPDDVRGLATDMLLGKANAYDSNQLKKSKTKSIENYKKLQQAAPDLDHNIITDLHEEYNLAKSGKNFYYNLAPDATGRYAQAEASKMAEELGIKGIKYKDQLSRGNRYQLKLSQNGKPYDADPIYARSKQELDQLTDDYRQKGFDVDVEEAGTSNLVIFDPRIIDIAKKYGVAIPVAGAILMQSEGDQTAQPEA